MNNCVDNSSRPGQTVHPVRNRPFILPGTDGSSRSEQTVHPARNRRFIPFGTDRLCKMGQARYS